MPQLSILKYGKKSLDIMTTHKNYNLTRDNLKIKLEVKNSGKFFSKYNL
jgi:hypothetical protein